MRSPVIPLVAAGFLVMVMLPKPAAASTFCVSQKGTVLLTPVCQEGDAYLPCPPGYVNVVSDLDCDKILAAPGCCLCYPVELGSHPNVATEDGCLNLCGPTATNHRWIEGSDCTGPAAAEEGPEAEVTCTCPDGTTAQAASEDQCDAACAAAPAAAAPTGGEGQITPPTNAREIPVIIGRIVKALLGVSGSAALAMMIYAGFLWLTSGGSAETIGKAQKIMIYAALGLLVVFAAYAVLSTVLSSISEAVGVKTT